MAQSIPQYAQENVLLIPESLFQMDDATCIMAYDDAAIFYKNVPRSMVDIEFFTNAPCLAYIMSGKETFSSFATDEIILQEEQLLFMPMNSFMVSDFVRTNGALQAFLFFFDERTIDEFLKNKQLSLSEELKSIEPYKVEADSRVSAYMKALREVYQNTNASPDLLRLKLLELLGILDLADEEKKLRRFLLSARQASPKRNIKRLLKDPSLWRLPVSDLAVLSGRSLTSFNRDFKRQFETTPQQWLISMRLERALELVKSSSMSVSEISMEVGYDNISHFISLFKKKYGLSPKRMRREENW